MKLMQCKTTSSRRLRLLSRFSTTPGRVCWAALLLFSAPFFLTLSSCSFDYGPQDGSDDSQPDIVMENVEYVRVRSGDPQARFQAERAARYEERKLMELRNFSFEQFGSRGDEINAYGKAGNALVNIDSGDIHMDGGVRIDVESEDIAIETRQLEWKDKAHTLNAGDREAVNIYQSDGTSFSGVGFFADARKRTWEFADGVSGTYVHEDKEDEADAEEAMDAESDEATETGAAVDTDTNAGEEGNADEPISANE